jgi:hypothetical protein
MHPKVSMDLLSGHHAGMTSSTNTRIPRCARVTRVSAVMMTTIHMARHHGRGKAIHVVAMSVEDSRGRTCRVLQLMLLVCTPRL